MSVSLLRLARDLGKNQRTIRRWCDLGLVTGAYRKRGAGHWRVRRWNLRVRMQIEASVAEFARRRTPLKASEAKLLKTVAQVFSPASLRRDDLLLASHGLNRKTLFTERLTDEQELVFWQTPIEGAITPRICRAADMPHSVLHVAAKMMLARDPSGKTLTAANLARELKLSRATLYRHFAPEKIRQALELNFAANELAKTSGELPMRRRISESRS